MKKLLLLLSCVSLITNPITVRAVPAEATKSVGRATDGPTAGEKRAAETKSVSAEPNADVPTRSVATGVALTNDAVTTLVGDTLWAGQTTARADQTNVSRAPVSRSADTFTIEHVSMAGAGGVDTTINAAAAAAANPLVNVANVFAVTGADATGVPRAIVDGADVNHVFLIKDATHVLRNANAANNIDWPFNEKAPAAADGLYAVAATHKQINYSGATNANLVFAFVGDAAIRANYHATPADNLTVDVAVVKADHLAPAAGTDLADEGLGKVGAELDLAAEKLVATVAPALIDAGSTLDEAKPDAWWDDRLERLYISLGAIAPTNGTDTASVVGVCMGKINPAGNGTFSLAPIMPLDIAVIANNQSQVICGKENGIVAKLNAGISIVSLPKVRTMHTSTGKDYLVVVGGVRAGNVLIGNIATNTKVQAIPLQGWYAQDPTQKGMLASKTDLTAGIAAIGDMALAADAAVKVGSSTDLLVKDGHDDVTDIQIVGDSVYVSVAGGRAITHKTNAGIFSSTAIFKEDGSVRAWTPWQRVGGNDLAKVQGFGVVPETGKIAYFSGDKKTNTTLWDAGDSGRHVNEPLSLALNELTNNGGVYGLYAFDGATPGFLDPTKTVNTADSPSSFELMVATGYKRVALIQAGKIAAHTAADLFEATKEFKPDASHVGGTTNAANAKTVYIFKEDGALAQLGAITCAEVGRLPRANNGGPAYKGWCFVGGQGGVAVLAKQADGAGWKTQNNGDDLGGLAGFAGGGNGVYPGGMDYQWNMLKDATGNSLATDVRKLVADNTYLYILTKDKLIRLTLDAGDFKNQNANAAHIVTLADIATNFQDAGAVQITQVGDEFVDMIVTDATNDAAHVAVATSKGVYQETVAITNADNHANLRWSNLIDKAGTGAVTLGQVVSMEFVNAKRGGWASHTTKLDGNLYVTAAPDSTNTELAVYRFNVEGGVLKAIAEPYKKAGATTPYFYKIGTIVPQAAERLDDRLNIPAKLELDAVPMIPHPDNFLQDFTAVDTEINLGLQIPANVKIAPMVKDPASGATYIVGEFGVRVNE